MEMASIGVFIAWISAFGVASGNEPEGRCNRAALEEDLKTLSENLLQDADIPGISFAVGGARGVIVASGAGVADKQTGRRAEADTIYQIGSITKMFSGTAFAKLVSEDRVSLSTPLAEAWPESSKAPVSPNGVITLQHVATHTAGLPRYPSNLERTDGDPILGFTDEQLTKGLELSILENAPGSVWEYSNFGYGVLSYAVYQLTGERLEGIVENEIAEPLDLKDTRFELTKEQQSRLATPYRDEDSMISTVPWRMGAMSAAGGLFSTVEDLSQYARWELTGLPSYMKNDEARYLAQAPLHRFPNRPSMAYGIGHFIMDDWIEGRDVVWHGGDVDGYAGALLMLPDEGLSFAYLLNRGIGQPLGAYQKSAVQIILKHCAP